MKTPAQCWDTSKEVNEVLGIIRKETENNKENIIRPPNPIQRINLKGSNLSCLHLFTSKMYLAKLKKAHQIAARMTIDLR